MKVAINTGDGIDNITAELFAELKDAGIKIIYRDCKPNLENTRLAEQVGANIIVVTGFDDGGRLPGKALGTFSIVGLISDLVKNIPVLATGGITDRRARRQSMLLEQAGSIAGLFLSRAKNVAYRNQ